jgi:hypothetical protein
MNLYIVIVFHMPATQVPPICFFLKGPVQSKLEKLENWEKTVDIEWKTSVTVGKMCLYKAIDNKQQKGGGVICGVSYLIFWYESRVRALARMDFNPSRRPEPRG